MKMITNKPIPEKYEALLPTCVKEGDILFAVVGDLNLKGRYAESLMVFTKEKVIAFDECYKDTFYELNYSEILTAEVKRLYGNAVFRVTLKTEKKKSILRFSYASAEVADAAAVFINAVNDGGDYVYEAETVKSVYPKQRCFCPKCGRKLPNPEAECINCSGKGKIVSKFARYVIPEKKALFMLQQHSPLHHHTSPKLWLMMLFRQKILKC